MLDRLTARERLLTAGIMLAGLAAVVLALLGRESGGLASLAVTALLIGLTVVDSRARGRRLGLQLQARTQVLESRFGDLSTAVQTLGQEARRPREDVQQVRAEVAEVRAEAAEVRAEVAEVQTAVLARLEELSQQTRNAWQPGDRRWDRLTTRLARDRVELQRQLLAMAQLLRDLDVDTPLPGTGGWAAEASTLVRLREVIQQRRPRLVVECGSGASTVWLGHMLRRTGGRLVSLEHDLDFAQQTRQQVAMHGLDDIVEVRDAPLRDLDLGGQTLTWYDTAAVADLDGVDLLFVDGPPQKVHKAVRYPALPVLRTRLGPGAVIVLDDGHRPGEQAVLARWLAEQPALRVVDDSLDRAVTLVLADAPAEGPATDLG